MKTNEISILVTICTRGRPILLDSCLASVIAQEKAPDTRFEIAVIENNAELTCEAQLRRHSEASGIPIHAVLEPELGIPFARNRCGRTAAEMGFDYALYIDDDEVAHKDWLKTFVAAARTYDADVLYGRVIPIYPEGTPGWMITPDINKRATGTRLTKAEGHNTLVKTSVFRPEGLGLGFDTSMRFTGGSDTDFFARVHRAGGTIIWVGEALVDETVPANRMTLKWQLHRTFRVAINIAVQHEKMRGRSKAVLRALVKGTGRLLGGLAQLPLAAVTLVAPETGKRLGFKALKQIASALGSFAYPFGTRPQPYKQVDGG
ncbi:MAG: glycosyltransferase [Proteobacteria bacterium]|nr:glycosyltransferase [Pseudomonadota bacterium]